MSRKYNNKDMSHASKYKVHKLHQKGASSVDYLEIEPRVL